MADPLSGVQVLELELLGEEVVALLADGWPLVEAVAPVARYVRDERITLDKVTAAGFARIHPAALPALVISSAAFSPGHEAAGETLPRQVRAYVNAVCPPR